MSKDVECPYCGCWQEINHDDGYGYGEDEVYEQECGDCEKTFVFNTSISYYYDAKKADCLNGGEHIYKPSMTYPVRYTKMICRDCDKSRKPTDEEMRVIEAEKRFTL